MGMPDPDYDEDGQRQKSVSFEQLQSELSESLRLVVGEDIVSAEVKDGCVVFTLENEDV